MKTWNFFAASLLTIAFLFFSACTPEAIEEPIVKSTFPTVPDASRLIIHFGTATQTGCMYSFSNCIWIGWGANLTNFAERPALHFDNGDAAGEYFGSYFPLTADYTIDATSAEQLGIAPQIIPAGFYPLLDSPVGKVIQFTPDNPDPVAPLVNPNNPQDDLGQLHNLAMQVIGSPENKAKIAGMGDDKAAVRAFILEKTFQFLEEAGIPVPASEQEQVKQLHFDQNFSDYTARQEETHLSANDKKAVLDVMNQVSGIEIRSTKELSQFVTTMTNIENRLAKDNTLDDPKMVLSTLAVMKYSRYYWYWNAFSKGNSGTTQSSKMPEWVWADIIGFELGGPAGSIAASVLVYLDTH